MSLIILLSLSACHENITVEEKTSLEAMEAPRYHPYKKDGKETSPIGKIASSKSKSGNADGFFL